MKLLVFQHIACEHPGIFRRFLREAGIDWSAVQLDEGATIPELDSFDALWAMGGPMDVWDTEEHPWLEQEKTALRRWVLELERPFLGLCLGHQLLADALGGRCAPLQPPEIGIMEVSLTAPGRADPLFAGVDGVSKCLQWHSVQVLEPPAKATTLARSPACACQAMRVGKRAYGIQYHVELENDTISNWEQVPAYARALEQALGPGAAAAMATEAEAHYADFERNARRLFDNFLGFCRN